MKSTFSFGGEDERKHFEKINEKLSNVTLSEISSTIRKIEFYIEHFTHAGKHSLAYRRQVDFLTNVKKVLRYEKDKRILTHNSS